VRGEWQRFYRFTLEPQFASDYEVSNWYLCHHPSSFFRRMLIAARAAPEARYALRDATLSIHAQDQTERKEFSDRASLKACLANEMGIRLPESPELDDALERVLQTAANSQP
jgi:N-hydroxyarylamine O-acetyltransferase